jgi:hypothetical protein
MPHIFESASSGRAKCRGCGVVIAKGELRFGERLPNPFAEGELTHWFHPACAAFKRPEPLVQALGESTQEIPARSELERISAKSLAHTRLQRIDGAERSPSGQAKCRHCHEPIEKGSWRIRVVFHEEGQFSPGGFIHLACRGPYFESADLLEPVLHFSPGLAEADREELTRELEGQTP